MRAFFLAAALTVLSACAASACVVDVRNDLGGSITAYEERLSEHYPRPLQVWYRAVIRDHTTLWTIKRDELIRLGVPSCQTG